MLKLYAVPPSHPCMTAMLMLDYKGIEFERVEMMPGMHRVWLRTLGFKGPYTPAIADGEQRYQGTREISRALDRIKPDPPLFPADPAQRAAVEEAELYCEQVLQMMARRLAITSIRHLPDRQASLSYGAVEDSPAAKFMNAGQKFAPIRKFTLGFMKTDYGATDHVAQSDLVALPTVIGRVNEWIAQGVIGNPEQPNAADFQIATSLQLLLSSSDLAPLIEAAPAADLARLAPPYPEQLPPALPERWLEPIRESVLHTAPS